jgi:hypothetical protein
MVFWVAQQALKAAVHTGAFMLTVPNRKEEEEEEEEEEKEERFRANLLLSVAYMMPRY